MSGDRVAVVHGRYRKEMVSFAGHHCSRQWIGTGLCASLLLVYAGYLMGCDRRRSYPPLLLPAHAPGSSAAAAADSKPIVIYIGSGTDWLVGGGVGGWAGTHACRTPRGGYARHCVVTAHPAAEATADVILTDILDPPPARASPHQRTVFYSGEPPRHYNRDHIAFLRAGAGVTGFDWSATYSAASDFPMFFAVDVKKQHAYSTSNAASTHASSRRFSSRYLATAAISNCEGSTNHRVELVAALQAAGIAVASFGRCGRTVSDDELHELCPRCRALYDANDRWGWKGCVIAHFKFHFAFENSNHFDYCTEKVYQPLQVGVLPVYWGAPNVETCLPTPDAAVIIDRFERFPPQPHQSTSDDPPPPPPDTNSWEDATATEHQIARVAAYMRYLDANDTAYAAHFRWQHEPYSLAYRWRMEHESPTLPCQICERVEADAVVRRQQLQQQRANN